MPLSAFEIMLIISTLLELGPLFQTYKIIKSKQTQSISPITYFLILLIGIMWLFYGIQISSLPLIIGNSIKLIASLSVILAYMIYKRKTF